MKKYYRPYMIDIKYELKTYKNVGKDYRKSQTADLKCAINFFQFARKIKNRKQTEYRICNTYSDWEKHMSSVLGKGIVNYEDMVHWLIYERNYAKHYLDAIKTILIPIYISLIGVYTVFEDREDNPIITLYTILFIIVFASVVILVKANEKVDFFDDVIEIAEKQKELF